MELSELRGALLGISAYRNLLEHPVLQRFSALLDALDAGRGEEALGNYARFFFALKEAGFLGLGDWLWDALRFTDSPYPLLVERGGRDAALENAARRDVETFTLLASTDCGQRGPGSAGWGHAEPPGSGVPGRRGAAAPVERRGGVRL